MTNFISFLFINDTRELMIQLDQLTLHYWISYAVTNTANQQLFLSGNHRSSRHNGQNSNNHLNYNSPHHVNAAKINNGGGTSTQIRLSIGHQPANHSPASLLKQFDAFIIIYHPIWSNTLSKADVEVVGVAVL